MTRQPVDGLGAPLTDEDIEGLIDEARADGDEDLVAALELLARLRKIPDPFVLAGEIVRTEGLGLVPRTDPGRRPERA